MFLKIAVFIFITLQTLDAVTVDLIEPTYEEGVLRTDKGGVITGPNLRIQAQKMVYTKKRSEEGNIETIEAEGDIMIEFGEYTVVGRRIEYDILESRGIVYDGRTGVDPWYFGGKELHINPDGSYLIYDGFATTSENVDTDWQIASSEAKLEERKFLSAKNVYFRFIRLPLFWLPNFKINLQAILDHPIRYTVRFGGSQGPRAGMTYEVFSWERWKGFLRLDYRLRRGLGGGFETYYRSEDNKQNLQVVNYCANDITYYNAKATTRYRLEGIYEGYFDCDKTSVYVTWDKLSDKDMATDYDDDTLQLETGKRTQFHLRRQENMCIFNFLTRVRVNDFQTVKEELPTLAGNLHPFSLGNTGIISENNCKLSYLEFEYTNGDKNVHDYNSPRYEFSTSFYRPFKFSEINFTPEIGGVSIFYGNNEDKHEKWMNIGYVGAEANTHFYKSYATCKHVVTPYIRYNFLTFPTTPPNHHYIFDLDDGWYRLNVARIGFDQSFFQKFCDTYIYRKLYADVWTNVFIDTETVHATIPAVYGKVIVNHTDRLRQTVTTGWDFREGILDHFNTQLEWTLSNKMACSAEFRYRSAYSWRKVDHDNFILDSFHSVHDLRNSQLSDQRTTLLLHYYYQFHPYWALEIESRSGWDRLTEPDFYEYQINIIGTIRSTWHVTFFWRHREDDDRVSVNFSVGLNAPNQQKYDCFVPRLEF